METVRSSDSFTSEAMMDSITYRLEEPIVVAVVGAKGGTCKTITVADVAHTVAECGYDAVQCDLDPQGTLTMRCGFDRIANPLQSEPVAVKYAVPEGDGVHPVNTAGRLTLFRGGRSMNVATEAEISALLNRAIAPNA